MTLLLGLITFGGSGNFFTQTRSRQAQHIWLIILCAELHNLHQTTCGLWRLASGLEIGQHCLEAAAWGCLGPPSKIFCQHALLAGQWPRLHSIVHQWRQQVRGYQWVSRVYFCRLQKCKNEQMFVCLLLWTTYRVRPSYLLPTKVLGYLN